jgi:hypothetical protein
MNCHSVLQEEREGVSIIVFSYYLSRVILRRQQKNEKDVFSMIIRR